MDPMSMQEDAFAYPRDFLENQFVYVVISPRAAGLSVGVNVNPTVNCNFCCAYCEVDRTQTARVNSFDAQEMASELVQTLRLVGQGRLRERSRYAQLPQELLQLRHVALSGDGEPTLAAHFAEATEPPLAEIEQYAQRLKRLKQDGAQIQLVQIYSATRPMARTGCSHLPLKSLSRIARTVREVAELRAEVF